MIEATDARIVSVLLIGGFFVFLTGAIRWKIEYEGPRSLDLIAATASQWRWIHLWMIGGVAVTLLGLGGLTYLFIIAGGRVYSSFVPTLRCWSADLDSRRRLAFNGSSSGCNSSARTRPPHR